MNFKTIVAVVLIALGTTAFAYELFSYANLARGVAIGAMHVSKHSEPFPPLAAIVGICALVAGFALLLMDKSDFKPTASP